MANNTWIALIRAIGPATHKVMSMAQLREACSAAGFESVTTVLATGNVLFRTVESRNGIQAIMDGIVASHGLDNAVFLRRPRELKSALARDPFPDAAAKRPSNLLVVFAAKAVSRAALIVLDDYDGPERIAVAGKEIYIDYAEGIGRSKLTPAALERRIGQPGTARNWNTLRKLIDAVRR